MSLLFIIFTVVICIYMYTHNIQFHLYHSFLGVTTHCGCIFHSPVAGFSILVFEVS